MVLEIAVVRGGYGWIFPKGDHINVGVGGNGEEGPKLRAELQRMCEAYGIDPDSAEDTRGYRLPMRLSGHAPRAREHGRDRRRGRARRSAVRRRDVRGVLLREARRERRARRAGRARARTFCAYQAAVERRIAPLTRAGWGAKRAFERFPRATYAVARLPITFRALEKLLQGDLPEPGAARGGELAAIRAIYVRVARRRGQRYCWFPISCMSLNIGRYIEMMMMPTMKPTPIIMSGSMIEVRDAIAESTSSS